ncbi:MAG: hypothetical protein SNG57_07885 [Rikenellaceae bacterium]
MNRNYLAPQIEVVEIEIENSILASSELENLSNGTTMGDSSEFFN